MSVDKEQLDLATKLNAVIETMARNASRVEQSFDTQVTVMEKLAGALSKVDASKVQRDLDALNKTKLDDVEGALDKTGKAAGGMTGKIRDAAQLLEKKLPIAAGVGVGAMSGLTQGIRNVLALGKGVTGFFTSLTGGLFNTAAAIIAIPFKMFKGLMDLAANANGMNELAQAIENLRKEFGKLSGPTPHAVIEMSKTLKGFSDTGLSSFRVFGTLAERIEAFTKLAVAMGGTFGRLTKEFERNGGAILAYQKGLGIADDQMAAFAQKAISQGSDISSILKDTAKYALELGKAFGVDSKVIGKDMAKAMVDVKHFAGATVKQIAEAATYARKLGVELEKITGTLDAFETFDTAAENAAKLSQSFGVTVDAFKLMEAQSPADQLDQLRKAFAAAGKSADTMSRQELKLLSQTTGLDEATAKMAFSTKNQGLSLDEIKKKSSEAEKKTLTQAEAMSKLADSIERLVKQGGPQTGSFFDMFIKGFFGGIQASKEFRSIILNIKRGLQQVYFEGVRLGRKFVELFPGVKQFLGGISDFFQPAKFKALAHSITDIFINFFKDLTTGKFSFSELMKKLQDNFFTFFDKESPSGRKTLEGFKTLFTTLAKVAGEGIKWISTKIAEAMKLIAEIIQDPSKLSDLAKAGKGGLGFLASVMMPIVEGLKEAWTVLAPAAIGLLKVVGHKIYEFLKSKQFMDLIKPALPFLAAALFGPIFSRAILGGLASAAIKSVLSGGVGNVIKGAGSALSGKAGGAVAGRLAGAAGPAAIIAAAAAIGRGVNEYTDQITTTMDRSTKIIAAGATGLIDGLTLGLLPKDLSTTLANTLASVTDMVFDAIKGAFGPGFGESLKRYMSSLFEVFGNIWSFFKNLFSGDQASFASSAKELGLSLLRFATSAFEYLGFQLPLLIVRLGVQVLGLLTNVLIKLVSASLGLITSGIDKVFGTNLTDKVTQLSNSIQSGVNTLSDKAVDGLKSASNAVSDASKSFQDTVLRSTEDQAKIAASAAASAATATTQASASATASAATQASKTMSEAVQDLQVVKDVKEDLASLEVFPQTLAKITAAIKSDALQPALDAVHKMVDSIKKLDDAMSEGNINKINVVAKLTNVARAAGLGAKANYSVQNKGVNITLNLSVTMDVGEVEKVVVLRKSSIIRDRLNYMTDTTPGVSPLPENTEGTVQPLAGAGRTR